MNNYYSLKKVWIIVLLNMNLIACVIQPIAPYDQITDQTVTQLQQTVDGLLLEVKQNINTPAADYVHHKKIYQSIDVTLISLYTRENALPHNQLTAKQIKQLQDAINQLEQLHKSRFSNIDQVNLIQESLDEIFEAILKLELSNKQETR